MASSETAAPNTETRPITKTFTVDLAQLTQKAHSATSSIFSKMDRHYIHSFADRKDMMRQYRDIPMALGTLYTDSDYVKTRHGSDLQITIDLPTHGGGAPAASSLAASTGAQLVSGQVRTRRRRQVTIVKESFSADEEHVFERLHESFTTLADEFGGKTIFEITDIFMKVSGDMDNLRACLQKEKEAAASGAGGPIEPMPCEWSYLEDIALSMPENSAEYRDLLIRKGREEIDKRKIFLLGAQGSIALVKDTNLVHHPKINSQQDVLIKTKTEEAAPPKNQQPAGGDVEMKDT